MLRERERERDGPDISSENYFSPPPFLVKVRKCNFRRKATVGRAEDSPSPHAEVSISRLPGHTALRTGERVGKFGGATYEG